MAYCICGIKVKKRKQYYCSANCAARLARLLKVDRKCTGEQIHINDVLSRRWELLYKVAKSEYFRELMYKVEQRYPITMRFHDGS